MVKKILIALVLLIFLAGIGFWYVFIKEEIVQDKSLLSICSNSGQIIVLNFQSAKFVTNVKYVVLKDTLKIEVKTTTVFNPFAHRNNGLEDYHIPVNPVVKYIMFGNSIVQLTRIRKCVIPI